jgi:predicted transcriptional regulator
MLNASRPPHKRLSELEHLVMTAVWERGPLPAEAVREALVSNRRLKDSTVRTILRRLEEKGYVEHEIAGRTYVYRGVSAPANVAVSAVRQIIDRFCGGSAELLLLGLVEGEVIRPEELELLAKKVAAAQDKRE